MKIQIEVSDFYLDEDDSLEEGLKKYIKNEVTATIFAKIKAKVETEIIQVVEKHVLENLSAEISKAIDNGKIKNKSGSTLVSINEYVQDCLLSSSSSNWQSFEKSIKDISKTFCDEMKRRYDLNFAANVVSKMIDNKLVKEDAVKMLLGEKP